MTNKLLVKCVVAGQDYVLMMITELRKRLDSNDGENQARDDRIQELEAEVLECHSHMLAMSGCMTELELILFELFEVIVYQYEH